MRFCVPALRAGTQNACARDQARDIDYFLSLAASSSLFPERRDMASTSGSLAMRRAEFVRRQLGPRSAL